jgi:multidrug efflux system membrane fusion protein
MTMPPPSDDATLALARHRSDAPARPSPGRIWLVGGALVTLVLILGGLNYGSGHQDAGSKHPRSLGAPVRVGEIMQRDMPVTERSVGTVLAETLVRVTPQVTGTIVRQDFHEGEFVEKGALLFEIDGRPFQAALAQAQANYERDEAQLNNALRDRQRLEALYKRDSASQQSRDTAVANAKVLVSALAADRAAVDMAQLNLEYTEIRAPVAGKTGPVLIQPGNLVLGAAGTPIVTLAEVRPIKVSFTLPENDLPRIQKRQPGGHLIATVSIPGGEATYSAPVDFISNSVSDTTGAIELRATFANQDLTLVPGQLVNVVVQLDAIPGALVMPRNAVNDSPTGPYVFVVEAKTARQAPVTVLFDDGENAAVTGDLHPGDAVITEGQLRVDPGAPVNVLGPSAPGPRMESDKVHLAR